MKHTVHEKGTTPIRPRAGGGLPAAALMAALALATASCASKGESTASDPLEPLNRAVFSFNHGLDEFLIRPITIAYRTVLPEIARNSISSFLFNLSEPLNALHAGLQGDEKGVETSLGRFVVNSSLGIGGLFDVADEAGLHRDRRTFGGTLASWGVESGPYIVLPVLGPSNVRNAAGTAADMVISPSEYLAHNSGDPEAWRIGLGVARVISARDQNFEAIDAILRNSLDPYIAARSAYMQRSGDALEDPFLDLEFEDEAG